MTLSARGGRRTRPPSPSPSLFGVFYFVGAVEESGKCL